MQKSAMSGSQGIGVSVGIIVEAIVAVGGISVDAGS